MATKTTVSLLDDMTGDPADETVTFGIDGVDYQIDLSAQHAGVLRDILDDYIKAGRKAVTTPAQWNGRRASSGSGRDKTQLAAARAWLRQQGHSVQDRGRIAAELLAKFDAAHQSAQQPAAKVPGHRTWA